MAKVGLTKQTMTVLMGLILAEMINCKDKDSEYFASLVDARDELKEIDDA